MAPPNRRFTNTPAGRAAAKKQKAADKKFNEKRAAEKQRDRNQNQPMDPGMSRAMSGNTGLAGLTENQVNTIINTNKKLNEATGGQRPDDFQSLGQSFGETGSKYRRPADKLRYVDQLNKIAEGLDAGASTFVGPDGITRLNYNNLGIKDDEGRTILSKQLPGITAMAPTGRQFLGDVKRAFTGYDTLQYTDPTSNIPKMVAQKGLGQYLVPGGMSMELLKNLGTGIRDYFSPTKGSSNTFAGHEDYINRSPFVDRPDASSFVQPENRQNEYDPDKGGSGGSGGSGGGGGITDPGTQPTLDTTNMITYWNPQLGKYVTGTYADYMPFAQVKDGGIIQHYKEGDYVSSEDMRDYNTGIRELKDRGVEDLLLDSIDERFVREQMRREGILNLDVDNTLNNLSGAVDDKVKIAALLNARNESNKDEIDAKINELQNRNNNASTPIERSGVLPLVGTSAERELATLKEEESPENLYREDLNLFAKGWDSIKNAPLELLFRSNIGEGSAASFEEVALNNLIAKGVLKPTDDLGRPITYDSLSIDGKNLVVQEAYDIARSENMRTQGIQDIGYYDEDMENMQMKDTSFPIIRNEGPISSEPSITSIPGADRVLPGSRMEEVELPMRILRGQETNDPMLRYPEDPDGNYNLPINIADGGIIGLGQGGMSNSMDMQAMDGMMFKDPEDGEQWEYNV